jgi:hypothetical protein
MAATRLKKMGRWNLSLVNTLRLVRKPVMRTAVSFATRLVLDAFLADRAMGFPKQLALHRSHAAYHPDMACPLRDDAPSAH